jgi:hypothetical protein
MRRLTQETVAARLDPATGEVVGIVNMVFVKAGTALTQPQA